MKLPCRGRSRRIASVMTAALTGVIVSGSPSMAQEVPSDDLVTMSGAFGRVVVNLTSPQLEEMWVRQPDGSMGPHSLLASSDEPLGPFQLASDYSTYVDGAYTYIVEASDDDEQQQPDPYRHESRHSLGHSVAVTRAADGTILKIDIEGVELRNASKDDPIAVQDWALSFDDDGNFRWDIRQEWARASEVTLSGNPAIYLRPFGGHLGGYSGKLPSVTSNIWIDPSELIGGHDARYTYNFAIAEAFALSENTMQSVAVPGAWAIYKLFTSYPFSSDLRLQANADSHLYRRGGQWTMFNEIGAQEASTTAYERAEGEVDHLGVAIQVTDKYLTGNHLSIQLPDSNLERSLRDLHGSLLNGGTLANQVEYGFGNNSEGTQYGGAIAWQANAISSGLDSTRPLASHPTDSTRALGQHLRNVLATAGPDGLTRYGYNGTLQGLMIDEQLRVVDAAQTYYLLTGDDDFLATELPKLESIIAWFLPQIDPVHGVFRTPPGGHWYYDLTRYSGYNTYINVLLYKALQDLADLEGAANDVEAADRYRETAAELRARINAVLWNPEAPGGARYTDWIEEGQADNPAARKEYFLDLVQWHSIAYGVATEEQAAAILETADRRLAELETETGYQYNCTISSLWPQEPTDNLMSNQFYYGRYTNGGCLLVNVYYEVVARAKSGDSEGAYRLLTEFAKRFDEMHWVGNNAAAADGSMDNTEASHGSGEPFLSDFVTVPSAVVHGLLGVERTPSGLAVEPHLPAGWTSACVDLMHMGELHSVEIVNGVATVTPVSEPQCRERDVGTVDVGTVPDLPTVEGEDAGPVEPDAEGGAGNTGLPGTGGGSALPALLVLVVVSMLWHRVGKPPTAPSSGGRE